MIILRRIHGPLPRERHIFKIYFLIALISAIATIALCIYFNQPTTGISSL